MDDQDVSAELPVPPNAAGAILTQVIPEIPSHTVSQAGTFFWGVPRVGNLTADTHSYLPKPPLSITH